MLDGLCLIPELLVDIAPLEMALGPYVAYKELSRGQIYRLFMSLPGLIEISAKKLGFTQVVEENDMLIFECPFSCLTSSSQFVIPNFRSTSI